MKTLVIFSTLFIACIAQGGDYAGKRPIGSPSLAARFRDDGNAASGVGNRYDNNNNQQTPKIPTDARGNADLVNRVNQWPRPNRPFWLLNSQYVEAQRNPFGRDVHPDPPRIWNQGGVF